jgi:hypothetical protein
MMHPRVSMLKFRLPFAAGQTVYLDGKMLLQPYTGPHSTETRLIVENAPVEPDASSQTAPTGDNPQGGAISKGPRLALYDNLAYQGKSL